MTLHPNIKLLAWFNFFLDFRFYSPVAIIYFAEVTGSYALGMSIFSITMLTSAVCEVPTGVYSDMIGRKQTLVLGALMSVLSVILYALGASFFWLALGAVLEGLARAFYSGNNEAFLHDTLAETQQEGEYAKYLGKTSSMFQWALAVAALLGGFLASISFALVMWLSVMPMVLGLALTFFMREPKIHRVKTTNVFAHLKEALSLFRTNKKLQILSLADIIDYAQGESGYLFKSAFVNTLWPLWAVGIAKMLSNVGAAISFEVSGKVISRFGALPVMMYSKLISWVLNLTALIYPTVASPVVSSSTSLLYGGESVASDSLLQQEYSTHQRSTMASLTSFGGSILFAVLALALGWVADLIGPVKALLILKLIAVVPIYLTWNLFKKSDS